jgi:hypothetical protein
VHQLQRGPVRHLQRHADPDQTQPLAEIQRSFS